MLPLLIFALTLLAAVLLSEFADRTIASTAVLFLVVGIAVGEGALGFLNLTADSPVIGRLADFALVAVLFTDAMKLGWPELRKAWRLPGRALFAGLPLTLVLTAILGHYVAKLSWLDAWLVGAALSPTDPVFASAIVGRKGISTGLRHLLNIESGLNDGLALPIVIGILSFAGATESTLGGHLLAVLVGAGIGVAVTAIILWLERTRLFNVSHAHEPLLPFAVGLTVFATAELLHGNEFIAAFCAGVTFATMRPRETEEAAHVHGFLKEFSELLKLAAVLVFGTLISPAFLGEISWTGYIFGALALLAARPLALLVALIGAKLGWRERLAAMWFGPKGFASVIYGLLILKSGVQGADQTFHLVALVTAGSIIAHSSTDVVMARWLHCAGSSRGSKSPAPA